MVKMNENNRNYIMNSLDSRFTYYSESIDANFRNNNTKAMRYFIKQIESTLNFIDGI